MCLPQGGKSLLFALLFEAVGEYYQSQPEAIVGNASFKVGWRWRLVGCRGVGRGTLLCE